MKDVDTTVIEIGDSTYVRIPPLIAKTLGITRSSGVKVSETDNEKELAFTFQ